MEIVKFTILTLLSLPYLVVVTLLAFILIKQKHLNVDHSSKDVATDSLEVSIIIAARNESKNIRRLVESLAQQNYPKEKFEIILVDDHSDDETAFIAEKEFRKTDLSFSLLRVENDSVVTGKRAALSVGVESARFNLFLFTDADVFLPPNWIRTMLGSLTIDCHLVAGPVIIRSKSSFFSRLEETEYISVSAMTAAFGLAGRSVMANGANMLVRKESYMNALSMGYQKGYPSGDDMFLVEFLRRNYGNQSMVFCGKYDAIVSCDSSESLGAFVSQRLRWAGKARGYRDRYILLVGLMTFAFNAIVACSPFLIMITPAFLWLFCLLIMLRALSEGLLIWNWSSLTRQKNLFPYYFVLLPLYPYYVLFIGAVSTFIKPKWKGRDLSRL